MADEATTATSAADESTVDSATTDAAKATATEGEAALGDAGKKALDAMKAERNAAKAEAKAAADELASLKAAAEGRDAEHKAQQAAQQVKDEALAVANQRILKAEVRAAAAGKLNDPQDALRFLDLSEVEVGSDGEVDGAAVAKLIDDLITNKPYLAAQGTRFQGGADGGARKESGPSQLTRADLARMSPDEIDKAMREGRTADLQSGK